MSELRPYLVRYWNELVKLARWTVDGDGLRAKPSPSEYPAFRSARAPVFEQRPMKADLVFLGRAGESYPTILSGTDVRPTSILFLYLTQDLGLLPSVHGIRTVSALILRVRGRFLPLYQHYRRHSSIT